MHCARALCSCHARARALHAQARVCTCSATAHAEARNVSSCTPGACDRRGLLRHTLAGAAGRASSHDAVCGQAAWRTCRYVARDWSLRRWHAKTHTHTSINIYIYIFARINAARSSQAIAARRGRIHAQVRSLSHAEDSTHTRAIITRTCSSTLGGRLKAAAAGDGSSAGAAAVSGVPGWPWLARARAKPPVQAAKHALTRKAAYVAPRANSRAHR